jgi:hypothetical protein
MTKKRYWEENKVSGSELMGLRMMRGKTINEMARLIKMDGYLVNKFEKMSVAPRDMVELYFRKLGITNSHIKQIQKIMKGEIKTFSENRVISVDVKKEVRKKYKNKCAHCGSASNLHFHHIEKYSEGGQNTVDNLKLLCVNCHAEEHKGEHYKNLIKSSVRK